MARKNNNTIILIIGAVILAMLFLPNLGLFAIEEDRINYENQNPSQDLPGEEEFLINPPDYNPRAGILYPIFSTIFSTIDPNVIRIPATYTDTYCWDWGDREASYKPNILDDIGSNELSNEYEICQGIAQFDLSDLPPNTQIIDVELNIRLMGVLSEEGNGVWAGFGLFPDLENYNPKPSTQEEKEAIIGELLGLRLSPIVDYEFQDSGIHSQEHAWFSFDITTESVKDEIIDNIDGDPHDM
ncbi:unnamed protein product, partial [marine sediment metagenome]